MRERAPVLPAGAGALLAGVVLDRWSSSTAAAYVSLALLFIAGILLAVYVRLEARSLARVARR
jgi:predicted MFS family arabinose efflux permease